MKTKKLGENPKTVPLAHFESLTKSYGTEALAPQSEFLAYTRTRQINTSI